MRHRLTCGHRRDAFQRLSVILHEVACVESKQLPWTKLPGPVTMHTLLDHDVDGPIVRDQHGRTGARSTDLVGPQLTLAHS